MNQLGTPKLTPEKRAKIESVLIPSSHRDSFVAKLHQATPESHVKNLLPLNPREAKMQKVSEQRQARGQSQIINFNDAESENLRRIAKKVKKKKRGEVKFTVFAILPKKDKLQGLDSN